VNDSRRKLIALLLAIGLAGIVLTMISAKSGVPSAVWSLKGNSDTQPGDDYLGTSDNHPLIIKTNSSPVMTLGSVGPVEVYKSLIVHGDETVDRDLSVGRNLSAAGGVSLSGSLVLTGGATIGGDLAVSGQTQFEKDAHVAGSLTAAAVNVSGTTSTGVLEITGGDLAEPFLVSDSRQIPAGAVVVIDERRPGQISLSNKPYDRRVAGIISGAGGINPGVIMYSQGITEASFHVALAGRVYAQADASNGPIAPGDLLTTSAIPGRVMKVTDYQKAQGAVVGKAMSSLDSGRGLVLTLVSLQ
jgi:hypothetical protein